MVEIKRHISRKGINPVSKNISANLTAIGPSKLLGKIEPNYRSECDYCRQNAKKDIHPRGRCKCFE
jgi:hypothetical protein